MSNLIIDADSIVYAAAFAAQEWAVLNAEGEVQVVYFSKSDALANMQEGDTLDIIGKDSRIAEKACDLIIENMLSDLRENHEVQIDDIEVWLTRPDIRSNFRYSVTDTYKANRKDFVKPVHYNTVRDYLTANYMANMSREGWEADDEVSAIGWQSWLDTYPEKDVIIASIDKDLDTCPGWHYSWAGYNRKSKYYHLTLSEARHIFWVSVLTGDKADNIIGLKGIGPKKADKALEGCSTDKEYYLRCLDMYLDKIGEEGGKEIMHMNCKLLYLMRHPEDKGWEAPL